MHPPAKERCETRWLNGLRLKCPTGRACGVKIIAGSDERTSRATHSLTNTAIRLPRSFDEFCLTEELTLQTSEGLLGLVDQRVATDRTEAKIGRPCASTHTKLVAHDERRNEQTSAAGHKSFLAGKVAGVLKSTASFQGAGVVQLTYLWAVSSLGGEPL